MDNEFQVGEHNINVYCRASPKYLWLATDTVVKVDNKEIGRIGGFRFKEKISGEFINGNRTSQLDLEIKFDLKTLATIPYKLYVDENLISDGRLKIHNWPLFLIPMIVLVSCFCCSFQIYLSYFFANNPAS